MFFVSKDKVIDGVKWLLLVFMLASFQLFDAYAWGKYFFLVCSVSIFILNTIKNNGRISIKFEPFHIMFFLFLAYAAFSAIWSIDVSGTLSTSRTLLRIGICFRLIYWSYYEEKSVKPLIKAVVFASYIVAVYTVLFYGFDTIMAATDDIRLQNEYANVNSIALFLSMGLICEIYLLLFDGFSIRSVFSILSVVIIAAIQSRKALVFVIAGVFLLILLKNRDNQSLLTRIVFVGLIIMGLIIGFYVLMQLPIFSAMTSRMNDLTRMLFGGGGKVDTSVQMRNKLVTYGLSWWLNHPLLGYGIAAPHVLARQQLRFDAYLHNNYVELLCGGGIIGFSFYYSMFAYLIVNLFKMKKTNYSGFALGTIMIILILLMSFGKVSYYSKTDTFELMTIFLIVSIDNRNSREKENDSKNLQVSFKS